jgi:hypothetical protein
MSNGKGLSELRLEWLGSAELRCRFPIWTDFAYPQMRAAWRNSPDLRARHNEASDACMRSEKKVASDREIRARDDDSRAKAIRQAETARARRGSVQAFTDRLRAQALGRER